MDSAQLIRLWCIGLAIVAFAHRPAVAEFTCSVKLEGTAQAGVERSGTVNWKNDGPALAAPLVRISAGDGVVVRLTANDVWASSIEFLATSSGLPPSRLHAGESGSLPFLVRSTTTDGKLELSYTTASAEPFPWTEIADSLKPSAVTDEAWSFALKTLKARFGTTWDSYLARFRADVDLFARNGCFERRMDRLMQYELARALGTDSVIPALSEAQDAARSARGLGLVLTRTYPSSVSARFASGMFGYGWTDNLSTVAELTDAKTLVFRTPGGASCTFTKASGSWQSEDVRDRTRLTETASAYVLAYQSGTVQTFAKANMRTASIADSSGNQLTFTWNGAQLAKIAHTDGQSLTFASANGLLVSVTDDGGRQATYAYANGLLTSVTSFDGLTTRYEYRPADGSVTARALARIVYPDGTTREFTYGEDGLVASLSVNGGKEKSTIVRREGEVTLTGPDGSKTVMKTGVTGEAYETKDALGGTSVSRYGADGLLKAVETPSGLTSTLKHDALGRVVETTSAGETTTSFAYEETFGNLRSVTDAKGHAVTYGYDSKGRGTSVTFPDNSSSSVEYNSRGDVVKTYNRRGESVAYAYDARGRLTKKTWSNGRTFTYAYDARGNVTEASDSETGTVKMEYDAAERMTKIEYPGGRGFTFAYDAYGRLTRRSSFDGSAECFAYDARGRLASVTDGEGNFYLRNVYDETTGRLVRQENGNGTSTGYLYDKMGRTTSIEHRNAEDRIVESLQYCYDIDGRCARSASLQGEDVYAYDDDGQLTGVFYMETDEMEEFAYDAVGNRTSVNAETTYSVNALNQYTRVEGPDGTTTFAYDADGNLTSMTDAKGTTTYSYDTLNRLIAVRNTTTGVDWSCKYDALGNRVSVTENGVTTERVYLQGSLPSVAAEYVNGELKSRHILVGAVRIADVSDTIRYLHADLIGSVRLVTDADGKTQGRTSYKVFGETRSGTSAVSGAGYVGTLGVETDSTGLLFMRNRYYSPALGRFIQADPIGLNGGDVNLYGYCGNDVAAQIDANGLKKVRIKVLKRPLAGNLHRFDTAGFTQRSMLMNGASILSHYHIWVSNGDNFGWYDGKKAGKGSNVFDDFAYRGWYDSEAIDELEVEEELYLSVKQALNETLEENNIGYNVLGERGLVGLPALRGQTCDWNSINCHQYTALFMAALRNAMKDVSEQTIEIRCGSGGSGSGAITSEADWLKISTNKNAKTATYSLGANVTLTKRKCMVYGFSGTLTCNGHTITLSGELADGGLFNSPNGATFNGAAFGNQRLASRIENCHFVNCTANYSGEGRGAYADVAIGCDFTDCKATVMVKPTGKTFGYGIGGFVGSVTSCEFVRCSTSGSVSGDTYIGGFVGKAAKTRMTGCRSSCSVDGEGDIVGGFAGQIGGGVEKGECLLEDCLSTGSVTGGEWTGGFAGRIEENGKISKCVSKGAVRGVTIVGGFAASVTDSVLEDCMSSGSVEVTSKGSAISTASAASFVAIGDGHYAIRRCFASGLVKLVGSAYYPKLAGLMASGSSKGESANCYWNSDSTGQKSSYIGTGLSAAKAKNPSSYSGWDFSSVWQMVDGQPSIPGAGAIGGADDDPFGGAADPAAAVDVAGDPASGSVSGTGTYEAGETVKLTARPAADCLFDGWYADAACIELVSTESTYSFVVEDPTKRLYAKFSTKQSKLDETRLYAYDRYVVRRGELCCFMLDGWSSIGTSVTVSGLPSGMDFYDDYMMIVGVPSRTLETTVKVTLTNAAGTKTLNIPFAVVAPEGEEEDPPAVEFTESSAWVSEGETLRIGIWGGSAALPSSVQLFLSPLSADLKDLDLTNVKVDGMTVKNAKFPLSLTWAAGELAEKVVEIPVKTDTVLEGYETFVLQLAAASGIMSGDVLNCWVTVEDETVTATLAQAVGNPTLKVSTSGDGKWIAAKGNDFYFGDDDRGVWHAESPTLDPDKTSTLVLSGVKGQGKMKIVYRFVGECSGETSAALRILADNKPLDPDTTLYHSDAIDGWYEFTFDEIFTGTHAYSYVFKQGSNPDVHVEIAYASWTPNEGLTPVEFYVNSNGAAYGTVAGAGFYPVGTKVKISAKPMPGCRFAGWYKWSYDTEQYELYDEDHATLTVTVAEGDDFYAWFVEDPYVAGLADSADRGKVTGSGYCAEGKKVTLKATANKGYVFMGWYRGDGTLVAKTASIVIDRSAKPAKDSASSTTITGITSDVTYYAVYVTAEEDKASISADVNGFSFGAGTAGADGVVVTQFATNVMAGVYLAWPVAASALSATTVKVAGLPSGLKFTAKPITSKVTSGTGSSKVTTVVTNVPANTIYGAPSVASKSDKNGNVTPSKVKVTVTTAGKSKAEYVIDLTVDPLPAWAQGEFSGLASTPEGRLGSVSMSVTAAGKVSGKVIVNGTNCTFSTASYDITSKTVGETNLVAVVTGKLGKEAVTGGITVVASGSTGTFADAEMALFRNVWKDKGAAPVPAEAQGLYTVKLGAGERGAGYLSLTVDKKGAVKVAGKAPDGTALSGSATLIPSGAATAPYFADVFCAPSVYKGGYVAGRLAWDADGSVSSDGFDWRSFNPQATADYYAGGFDRTIDLTGARYVKEDAPKKLGAADVRLVTPEGAELKTFSFTQSTGIWKGTLLWNFGNPSFDSVKVPFEGVMVQGEGLDGFGTYDVPASYVPYDKKGQPQTAKTYKVKKSMPVWFVRE